MFAHMDVLTIALLGLSLILFGALVVPDVGEVRLLGMALGTLAQEDQTLKLFATNVTPAEGDTASTYTEAAGGGYAAKTLTAANWPDPTTAAGVTSSSYAEQTFTFTGALTTNPTIYGYYVVGAISTVLLWAELAGATFTPANNGDTYKVTPKLEAA